MADESRVTVRLGPDDERRLRSLMADMGITSQSDIVRHALAELCKARGLATAVQQLHQGETSPA